MIIVFKRLNYPANAADTNIIERALSAMAIRHLGDFFMPVSCLSFGTTPDLCERYHIISSLQNEF